jgi:hypothetical protein
MLDGAFSFDWTPIWGLRHFSENKCPFSLESADSQWGWQVSHGVSMFLAHVLGLET